MNVTAAPCAGPSRSEIGAAAYRVRMASPRQRRPGLLLAPVAVALATLVAGAALLSRQGALTVQQCVPGDGAAGWLGLRLALLRADVVCPTGTLAVGGDSRQVMGVVVLVALPALLAHVAGVVLGLGLLARVRTLVRAAAAVLAAVLPRLPRGRVQVVRRAPALLVSTWSRVAGRLGLEVPWRRGPPELLFV